jgi:hypothetical protein
MRPHDLARSLAIEIKHLSALEPLHDQDKRRIEANSALIADLLDGQPLTQPFLDKGRNALRRALPAVRKLFARH